MRDAKGNVDERACFLPLTVQRRLCAVGGGWHCRYAILRPYLMTQGGLAHTMAHGVLAHWLLINVVFHYYKVRARERCCRNVVLKRQQLIIACGVCPLVLARLAPFGNSP